MCSQWGQEEWQKIRRAEVCSGRQRQTRADQDSAENALVAASDLIGSRSSDHCIDVRPRYVESSRPTASARLQALMRPTSQASARIGEALARPRFEALRPCIEDRLRPPAEYDPRLVVRPLTDEFSVEGPRVGMDGSHAIRKFSRAVSTLPRANGKHCMPLTVQVGSAGEARSVPCAVSQCR